MIHVSCGTFATGTRKPALLYHTARLEWVILLPGGATMTARYAAHHDDKDIRTLGNAAMILNHEHAPVYRIP